MEMHKVPQMLGDNTEELRISINDAKKKATIAPSKDPKEMQDWIMSLIASATEEEASSSAPSKDPNVMHKVPQHLRTMANCEGYYKPRVVSIGPYHGCNTGLKEVQKLKPKIAKQFHQKEKYDDLRQFFKEFKEMIEGQHFRKLYSENTTETTDDEPFKQMMFLDGCFILGFIQCIANDRFDKLGMKSNIINSVQKDLFLLENQLPCLVLQVLIELKDFNKIPYWEDMLAQFVHWKSNFSSTWREHGSLFYMHGDLYNCGNHVLFPWIKSGSSRHIKSPDHLLHIQWTRLLGKRSRHIRFCLPTFCEASDRSHLFRGVKELTEAGIKLRPNQTGYIKDVNFWSYGVCGSLTLPRMTIDNSTMSMFFNMIAYEECIGEKSELWFTSYIRFLDLLIDHAEDVKELRTAGILDNRLGSDQQVATLFNEMAVFLAPVGGTYDYIKEQIDCHYSVRKKIWPVLWVLEGIHNHFSKPWTYLAVLGGFIAIFLTAVQTYFTVFPRKS